MTGRHFSEVCLIKSFASCLVARMGCACKARMRVSFSGSDAASLIALFSFSRMATGVPTGADHRLPIERKAEA